MQGCASEVAQTLTNTGSQWPKSESYRCGFNFQIQPELGYVYQGALLLKLWIFKEEEVLTAITSHAGVKGYKSR